MIKYKDKKAVALIVTYMVLIVLSILAVAFYNSSISHNTAVVVFRKRAQAFNVAEAGLDKAINWLRVQPAPPIGDHTNPWGAPGNLGVGTYTVTIYDLGAPGAMPTVRRYKIVSTGTAQSITQTLTNYVQTDNYARYIWFTDRETFGGTNVWFWRLDRLNGPTHTNGHFNIYGNPVFAGEVRSADDYIRYYNNGNNINLSQISNPPYDIPDFQQGITFGAPEFNMPAQALNLRTASINGGLRLQGNTTVVLNSNGTMDLTNAAYCVSHNCDDMALPANGALFVACSGSKCSSGASLTISGTLNGRLTAGAQRDVYVPASIVYAEDPRINPAADDTLGLIAEEDIVIKSNAPTNLEIDASLMALNTSFMLENWWVGPPKDTLTVFGGIIQDERGPVGTFNGSTGQKVSGYSKNYTYDGRLLNNPPPFFPTTGDYITLSWEN